MNRFVHGVVRAVTETFPLPGPILEIGSYQVPGQEEFANLRGLFPGVEYLGVDLRPGPGVDEVADVENLPFADESFGTILALNTFEHVRRFWRGFEEARRVLRPDGVLLVTLPFYFHIHDYPCDYWRFTPEALAVLLEGYPYQILGQQGPRRRPACVWAVGFREEHGPPTRAQFDQYRALVERYARLPLPWVRRLRYRFGRWLCGRGPFAPYLDRERWETEWRTLPQERTALGSQRSAPADRDGSLRMVPAANPIDVSVCIANWNCRDLLRRCLQSLQEPAQGVRVETIVVDNASQDGAAEMIDQEFPEVILQRNPVNAGFARANNQAVELSRGNYLFFLNNDTVVPPGTLRQLCDFCRAHPSVGLVGPRLRDGQGRPQVSYRQRPTLATLLHRTSLLRWTGLLRGSYRRYRRQDFDPNTLRPVEILMGAAMFLPREVFFTCGPWDEDFTFGGEDMELSVRVGRHYQVIYLPSVEITHFGRVSTRQHIGFATSNMTVGFARYLRKCGVKPTSLALYKLVVTLDAPVQMLEKGIQYLWRRLQGRHDKAEKSLLAMRGLGHFLVRGLVPLWKV